MGKHDGLQFHQKTEKGKAERNGIHSMKLAIVFKIFSIELRMAFAGSRGVGGGQNFACVKKNARARGRVPFRTSGSAGYRLHSLIYYDEIVSLRIVESRRRIAHARPRTGSERKYSFVQSEQTVPAFVLAQAKTSFRCDLE